MTTQQAATEASATSTEQNQEQSAAAAAESATAAQETSTTTSETTAQDTGSEPAKEGELGEKGKQEIIRLRKRAQEAERQAAYEKGQREATERLLAGKTEAKTPDTSGYHVPRPVQGDSETFEDFTTRLSDWAYDRRQFQEKSKAEHEKVKAQHQTIMVRAEAQRVAGEQKYPDFEERVSALDIPQALLHEVIESDIGHDLAYHFATHPDELKSITALPFNQQLKHLGRLEDKLKAGVVTQTKTTAPPPPPTLSAGKVTFDEAYYLSDKISTAERIKMSAARKAARRQGQ